MQMSLCGGTGSCMCHQSLQNPMSHQQAFSKYAVIFKVCGQPEMNASHLDKNCLYHCTRSQVFSPQQGSPREAASSCSKGVNVPN